MATTSDAAANPWRLHRMPGKVVDQLLQLTITPDFGNQKPMKPIKITSILVVIALLFGVVFPYQVWAHEVATYKGRPASSILSVWSVSQSCGQGVATLMRRHPEQEAIRQAKELELSELDLKLRIWQHPDSAETTVKILLNDRARGVVDHYVFLSPDDLSNPTAAIIVSELGGAFDPADKALSAVHKLEQKLAHQFGAQPNFERVSGPYGTAIEMVVPDRTSSACFPTSDFRLASKTDPKMIGISRFVFFRRKLIEFALVLEVPNEAKSGGEVAYAKRMMDDFWQTIWID